MINSINGETSYSVLIITYKRFNCYNLDILYKLYDIDIYRKIGLHYKYDKCLFSIAAVSLLMYFIFILFCPVCIVEAE